MKKIALSIILIVIILVVFLMSTKEYPMVNQWTGKLFKDYPPVLFGFVWQSFGCDNIDIIQLPLTTIPILCDNRH